MKGNLKQFLFHTPSGKLVLALTAMLLSWGYLLLHFSGDVRNFLPSAAAVEKLKDEVRQQKEEFETLDRQTRENDALRARYRKWIGSFWNEETDGDVTLVFREQIDQAAALRNIKLTSLGSVRTSKIAKEFFYAELDVAFSGSLEEIVHFLAAVQAVKPVCPAWKRADLRPEMTRSAPSSASGSGQKDRSSGSSSSGVRKTNVEAAAVETEQKLRFSGTIRILCRAGGEEEKE